MTRNEQANPCEADRLLTLQEVARRLDVPETTIYGWRYLGKGPRGHRVGKYVRYWWSDVLEWLEHRADPNPRNQVWPRPD